MGPKQSSPQAQEIKKKKEKTKQNRRKKNLKLELDAKKRKRKKILGKAQHMGIFVIYLSNFPPPSFLSILGRKSFGGPRE